MKRIAVGRVHLLGIGLVLAYGCGGSLGPASGTGGSGTGGGAAAGGVGGTGTGGSGGDIVDTGGTGGDSGGTTGTGGVTGTGGTGTGGTGTGGQGGIFCGDTACASGQVCVHPSCGGGVAVCTPPQDAGTCPAGWTYMAFCVSRGGPGCTPPPCDPPLPYCADVPAACAGTPTCICLPSDVCARNGGNGGCMFANASAVMCGSA
jgi:hypothetical protein